MEGLEERALPSTLDVTNNVLTFTAAAGFNNNVTVSVNPGPLLSISDSSADQIVLTTNAMNAGWTLTGNTAAGGGAKPSSTAAANAAVAFSALCRPGTCTVIWATIAPNGPWFMLTVKLTARPWERTSPSR